MSILSTSPAKSFLNRKKHNSQSEIQISQSVQYHSSNKVNNKDFCNSFWGQDSSGTGFDILTNKIKSSAKTIDDLKLFWKERASIEDDYARKLAKLSRFLVGSNETGAIRDSLDTLSVELEQTSQNHFNLSQNMRRELEVPTSDWSNRMSNFKKTSLASIEKKYKVLQTQESYAKAKYTDNCVSINTFTAQKSLLQGKDLERVDGKLDKAKSAVGANERDYINFVRALSDTRKRWEADWRLFCDQCQDEEEERIEFIKTNMWEYANEVSTVCVADDESCEKLRQALEQVDPDLDIEIFVDESMTGNTLPALTQYPEQPTFVDFSRETQAPSPAPRYAAFHRNSVRPLDVPKEAPRALASNNQAPKQEVVAEKPPPPSPKKHSVIEEPKVQKAPPRDPKNDENKPFKVPQLPARSADRPAAPKKEDVAPPKPEKEEKSSESGDVDELAAALAQLRNAPPVTGNLRANVAAQAEKKPRSRPVSQQSASTQPALVPPGSQMPVNQNQNKMYQGLDASQIQALQIQQKYAPHTTPPFPAMMQRPASSQSTAGGPVEDVLTTYHQQLPHERSRRNSKMEQQSQGTTPQTVSPGPTNARPLSAMGRSPSREGFAGIGANGAGSRQPSPSISAASPQRSATPLGISLNASGEVAHDQKAEEWKEKRRSVSPSPTPAPVSHSNMMPAQQQQQMQQAQAYYQYQMMLAQQSQQQPQQAQQPQHPQAPNPYQQYQQYYPYPGQQQMPQQPYVMTNTPGPGYNPQFATSGTPAPMLNAYQQQQQRAPSPSPTPAYSMSVTPGTQQQPQQTPFVPSIQTQQLSQTPQPLSSASGTSQQQMYRQPSPGPTPRPISTSPAKDPVLFHVKALYDYQAQTAEEFDFKAGDVIAVFKTPEDGWWTGQLLNESRYVPGKTLFPSNFVSLF
ncbi:hypothetical protein E3Q10_02841 [Wallemia mellicola]|uniref:SH3 domain-containing protein n=1 Tax=Wallemia mellicola TaxID=1708541 RepID=A0A4T0PHT4_9BASI|nr:hypothetical protein E3Q14_02854 [Wallemia mellicola]TIC10867.1 hypothetical protein E3Q15_02890 [Wallemia mellicola]TIC28963.1 hypothetical protein E3Q10_02841 [Wallemia mellicola]TIC53357.1 hypothetical protein E3Q05_02436 [Wallemia mellicola]